MEQREAGSNVTSNTDGPQVPGVGFKGVFYSGKVANIRNTTLIFKHNSFDFIQV